MTQNGSVVINMNLRLNMCNKHISNILFGKAQLEVP